MRDYGLTAFIIALLPLCLMRPWIGIVVWYWFGLMNPHRHTWDFAFSMPFAALIGGATLIGAVMDTKDRKPIPWNAGLILVMVLVLYFTITTIPAWAPEPAWLQWRKVIKIALMTFVATMFIYGRERIYALMLTIALSIGFYGVKGFVFVVRSGGGERVQGPDGTFIEGNTFMGLALNMVLPILIYLARGEQRVWLRRLLYTTAAMTVVSIIFTYSRGAYVGLAVIVPMIFWRSQKKLLYGLVIALAVVMAPHVLPDSVFKRADLIENYEEDSSATQRLQSWTVAWNLAKDYPLTGAGFEFEYASARDRWLQYGSDKYSWALSHSSAAHSIYFQVLGQHGFVAFGLYLALLIGSLVSLQRLRARARASPGMEWIANYATGLQIGLVGYMVSGAFLSSAYFDLAYLYFALIAILWREMKSVAQPSGTAVALPESAAANPLEMVTPRPGMPMPSKVALQRAHRN